MRGTATNATLPSCRFAPYEATAEDTLTCPNCGKMNDADAMWCDQCGVSMGMGAEAVYGLTFDEPEVAASFRVNTERRTISGLLVPWNKVAKSGFAKWRFAQGSLRWSDASRVKLNLDHEHKDPVAVATRLQNTAAGLDGTFKVARGPRGDQALSEAEDRVRDGFSIEVDFEDEDGWMPDPDDEDVRLVRSGRLGGVALTGFPAFDDARVAHVAAMKKGPNRMDEKQEPQEAGAEFEAHLTAMAERVAKNQEDFLEQFGKGITDTLDASNPCHAREHRVPAGTGAGSGGAVRGAQGAVGLHVRRSRAFAGP